jgi:hypothetical protein
VFFHSTEISFELHPATIAAQLCCTVLILLVDLHAAEIFAGIEAAWMVAGVRCLCWSMVISFECVHVHVVEIARDQIFELQFADCALKHFCRQLLSTWLGGGHLLIGGTLFGVAANVDFNNWRPENRNLISSGMRNFLLTFLFTFFSK